MQDSQKDLYNKNLGVKGEKLAVRFLKKSKYKILEKNYTTPFGEADIIAKDKDTTVFVEVKTRTSDSYGAPAEAVGKTKQLHYKRIAAFYLKSVESEYIRFDVVEVLDGKINHIKNAF